jgi:hypothetical protein
MRLLYDNLKSLEPEYFFSDDLDVVKNPKSSSREKARAGKKSKGFG